MALVLPAVELGQTLELNSIIENPAKNFIEEHQIGIAV